MLALVLAASLASAEPCADLCSSLAHVYYADLLQRGGYGRFPFEVAAFLIRESDGRLTTEPWPDREHRRARFRGAIPRGAIAVLHTHPHSTPNLSAHDRDEARRIAMPVVVISPLGVQIAYPDGTHATLPGARDPGRGSAR